LEGKEMKTTVFLIVAACILLRPLLIPVFALIRFILMGVWAILYPILYIAFGIVGGVYHSLIHWLEYSWESLAAIVAIACGVAFTWIVLKIIFNELRKIIRYFAA
jgi:hypothetical protein